MPDPLVSIAVMEPTGSSHEEELLAVLGKLYSLMEAKDYSQNVLLRSRRDPVYFINVRYWSSEEARQDAHDDPEIHRCWERLGQLCHIPRVHEILDVIDWKSVLLEKSGR